MTDLGPGGATAKNMAFPLNAWYVAAWDYEVTSATLLARRIADKPMTLYRTTEGRPVALADACWHRLAPLSLGTRVGADEVQCPYHGLRFNSAGRCTKMPAQETINPRPWWRPTRSSNVTDTCGCGPEIPPWPTPI